MWRLILILMRFRLGQKTLRGMALMLGMRKRAMLIGLVGRFYQMRKRLHAH